MFFLKLYQRVHALERGLEYRIDDERRLQERIWELSHKIDRLAAFLNVVEENVHLVRYVKKAQP